jgi:N6-adenosine-specific RNA methylase IME4
MTYKTILIDPPWPEQGGGKCKRGADRHYKLIKKKEQILKVILRASAFLPDGPSCRIEQLAFRPDPDGCHLWLWVTNNYLPWGLWLTEALGFRYISNVAWAKMEEEVITNLKTDEVTSAYRKQNPGLGQYLRGQHELLLFGVMGRLKTLKKGSTLLCAPRGKHSEKPVEAYNLIETVSPGPRLEMFARKQRVGWDVWGDES